MKHRADVAYELLLRENGLGAPPSRYKLHKLIDEYWAWYKRGHATSSIDRCKSIVQSLKDRVPNMPAEDMRPFDVSKWIAKSKAKAADTIHERIGLVIEIFNWGMKMGLVKQNPIANMPRPTPEPREDFVPPKKFKKLLKSCGSPEATELIKFMAVNSV